MMRSGEIVICEQEAENVRTVYHLAGDDKSAGEIIDGIVKDDYFDDNTDKIISKIHGLLRKKYYYGAGTYPAIVTKDDFDKARLCISKRDHFHCTDKTRIPYKLTQCRTCGCRLARSHNAEDRHWKCGNTSCRSHSNIIPEDELYRQIIEILNKVQTDPALLDINTILTKYVPTKRIMRGESIVLARCYSKPLDYDKVKKDIAALASLKYDCCTYSRTPALTREIKSVLSKHGPIDQIDPDLIKAVLKKIILNSENNISIEFINGKTIKYGGNEDV